MKLFSALILSCVSLTLWAQTPTAAIPQITTQGKAHVYAIPDEVLVDVTIRNESNDLNEAAEMSDAQAKKILAICKDYGIAPEHAQSRYRRYGRNYRYKDGQLKFEASQTINICLKDLKRYDAFMKSIIGLEVHSVSGATFRTTNHRELMDEARKKAVIAAKEKAIMLAGVLEQGVGRALNISEVDQHRWGGGVNAYANTTTTTTGGAEGDGSSFAPGQLKIEAEVSVTFALN